MSIKKEISRREVLGVIGAAGIVGSVGVWFPWLPEFLASVAGSGQELEIKPCEAFPVVIQSGDTPLAFAKRVGTTVTHLFDINPYEKKFIAGHVIYVDRGCRQTAKIGEQFSKDSKQLVSDAYSGDSLQNLGMCRLPGTEVYPFITNHYGEVFAVSYISGGVVKSVEYNPENQFPYVVIERNNGTTEEYGLNGLMVQIGQTSDLERKLQFANWEAYGSEFAHLSVADKKNVIHRAAQVLNGGISNDYYYLDKMLKTTDPKNSGYSSGLLTNAQVVNYIAEKTANFDNNKELQAMNAELALAVAPINTALMNSQRPEFFASHTIPQIDEGFLRNIVLIKGSGYGGESLGSIISPIILYGPYLEDLKKNPAIAKSFYARNAGHEKCHGLQGLSKQVGESMVYSRDGYTNFNDPRSAITHISQWTLESITMTAMGVSGNPVSDPAYIIADRLFRAGYSASEIVKHFLIVAINGDFDRWMASSYANCKLKGDPKLEDLLSNGLEADQWIDPGTPEKLASALQKIAALERIPIYALPEHIFLPGFIGPDFGGMMSIAIKPQGSMRPIDGYLLMDFRPESKQFTRSWIRSLLENDRYLRKECDADIVAFMFRADRNWLAKFYQTWLDVGKPAKLGKEDFMRLLKAASERAYAMMTKIIRGPDLILPLDGDRMKLNIETSLDNVPSEGHRLIAIARTKEPWEFRQPGLGRVVSEVDVNGGRKYDMWVEVGGVRPDEKGNPIINCPPGSRVGYWKISNDPSSLDFVDVGRWI